MLATTSGDRDAADFRSFAGQEAGEWVEAIPTDEKFITKPNAFSFATSNRLGMPKPFTQVADT